MSRRARSSRTASPARGFGRPRRAERPSTRSWRRCGPSSSVWTDLAGDGPSAERSVPEQVAGAGSQGCGGVARVVEAAGPKRQAAATDARREPVAEAFEAGDLVVQTGPPRTRE